MIRDLTNQKFGKLTVKKLYGTNKHRAAIWECECECGQITYVLSQNLLSGHTKSCGCSSKHGGARRGHEERLYHVWQSMKQRCENVNNHNYVWYGANGIDVCDEWQEYMSFKKWAYENGYNDDALRGECTLDRIDVKKGYSPQNCRWTSMADQNRNKSYHRYVEYRGEKYTVTQLADKVGMNKDTLVYRLNANWSVEDAINKPINRKHCGAKMVEPQERSEE